MVERRVLIFFRSQNNECPKNYCNFLFAFLPYKCLLIVPKHCGRFIPKPVARIDCEVQDLKKYLLEPKNCFFVCFFFFFKPDPLNSPTKQNKQTFLVHFADLGVGFIPWLHAC